MDRESRYGTICRLMAEGAAAAEEAALEPDKKAVDRINQSSQVVVTSSANGNN